MNLQIKKRRTNITKTNIRYITVQLISHKLAKVLNLKGEPKLSLKKIGWSNDRIFVIFNHNEYRYKYSETAQGVIRLERQQIIDGNIIYELLLEEGI